MEKYAHKRNPNQAQRNQKMRSSHVIVAYLEATHSSKRWEGPFRMMEAGPPIFDDCNLRIRSLNEFVADNTRSQPEKTKNVDSSGKMLPLD